MERLTEYDELGYKIEDCKNIVLVPKTLLLDKHYRGKAIDKLSAFEDFMEENDFENLDLLKATLKMKTQSIQGFEKLSKKFELLNSRWEKLKEWVIKEQGFTGMHQEERVQTLEEIKDKMYELEQGEEDVKD